MIERRPPAPRSLLANTLANALAVGLVAGVTFILAPFLIRELGTAEYGVWVLLTIVMVAGRGLTSLLDLGLQQSLIQRVAGAADHGEAEIRFGAGLRVLLIVAPIATITLALVAPALVKLFDLPASLDEEATLCLRLLAIQLLVELPTVAHASVLEGLRRYDLRRGADVLRSVCFAATTVAVTLAGHGLVGIAVASLGSTVIYAVALIALVHRCQMHPVGGGGLVLEARAGLPLLALRFTGVGYRQLDKIVLGLMAGTVATAGFDVAEKATLIAMTVLGVATSALIPAGAAAKAAGGDTGALLARRATFWCALAVGPIVGLLIGLAVPITEAVAGTTISGAAHALRWLALTAMVAAIYAAAFEMTIGAGHAASIVPLSTLGLGINLVATVVLVSIYGLPGSAAASFIATGAVAPWVTSRSAHANGARGRDLVRAALPGMVAGSALALGSWAVVR